MNAVVMVMMLLTFRRSVSAWSSGIATSTFSRSSRSHSSAMKKRCLAGAVSASYTWPASTFPTATGPRLFVTARDDRQGGGVAPLRSVFESTGEDANQQGHEFRPGTLILVEVLSFGPLGGSVHVVGLSHNPDDVIPENEPPLATGLILQKEIHYFRQSRGNVDVVRGEVLPAYVEKVRDDGKLDIALRPFGGRAKTEEASVQIMNRLKDVGEMPIGDKSPPEDIAREFPGMSKGAFKKALAALYKINKVQPGPYTIQLISDQSEEG
jgi:CvfB-like winged helix domain